MNNKKLQQILNETNAKLISPQITLPETQVTGDENYITITANKSDNEGNYVLTTMDWVEIKFDYFKMLKDRNIPLDSVKSCFINFMPLYKIAINSIDIYMAFLQKLFQIYVKFLRCVHIYAMPCTFENYFIAIFVFRPFVNYFNFRWYVVFSATDQ